MELTEFTEVVLYRIKTKSKLCLIVRKDELHTLKRKYPGWVAI